MLSLPQGLNIRHCRECALRWLDPRPRQDVYDDLYRWYYYESVEEFDEANFRIALQERNLIFLDRLQRLQGMVPKGARILDVGAASGDFVAAARRLGFKGEGIEPSDLARKSAFEKHCLELKSSLADLESGCNFHVIHLNHVLEHILDPLEFLASLSGRLTEGGFLAIEVPYQFDNIVEARHRLLARDNSRPFSIYSIHHPFFYSPRALRRLLVTAHFEKVALTTWNRNIIRGSRREKWLLRLGDLFFGKGDFVEVFARKGHGEN